jgi:transketolase
MYFAKLFPVWILPSPDRAARVSSDIITNYFNTLSGVTMSTIHERAADNIRILAAAMVEKAKSGHPGGAMGGADFIHILFSEFLSYDPDDMAWPFRDRFFLDPGHMSPMLYSVLALCGTYTLDEIAKFRQWGSPSHGHPERNIQRGIENTSGPLGQGHAIALGVAIAERFLVQRFGDVAAHKTFVYISDGGVQEEISQGVARLTGHLGLANYIMFYDSNDIQLSHPTSTATSEDVAKKYEAFGWHVETIDGNNADQIRRALKSAVARTDKPTIVIGKTVMGKGALDQNGNSFERKISTHGMPLSKAGASIEKTIAHLGGDPQNPFVIFPDVAELYAGSLNAKRADAKARKKEQAAWEKANPALSAKLNRMLSGKAPEMDFGAIVQKAGNSTRAASGLVLETFSKTIENMIVSSADLSNSDNTDGFLKNTSAFAKGNFSGAFLQSGVAELTMAAVMNGMAIHGGVIPVCGTFFVFSDYMKPAVRMAALMGLPVKYVWTHDSFRVGEDGPTHQPVEQEAQIRLMEKMKNLDGKRSVLVLRPADAAETSVAWKIALQNTQTPTALILTRQNIPVIPAEDRYTQALGAEKGAYIISGSDGTKPDLILLGNGSDVSLLVSVAEKVAENKGLSVRVVSAISEGLFREQSQEYQESVLPFGVPVYALTSGLPDALAGMTGPLGTVEGLDHFGYSAPFNVLEEQYGFTADSVLQRVEKYIDRYKSTVSRIKSSC